MHHTETDEVSFYACKSPGCVGSLNVTMRQLSDQLCIQASCVDAVHAVQPRAGLAVEGKRNVKALEPATHGSTSRFLRRHAPASHNLMFVSNGDSNGVSHWLGTCYGTQAWVNPVLAGRMQVTPCPASPFCPVAMHVVPGQHTRLDSNTS